MQPPTLPTSDRIVARGSKPEGAETPAASRNGNLLCNTNTGEFPSVTRVSFLDLTDLRLPSHSH